MIKKSLTSKISYNSFPEHFSRLAPLQYFDPQAFKPDKNFPPDVCGFILSLSLIYNDIKNTSLLNNAIFHSVPPGDFKETKEWGEFSGLREFIDRITIGISHELFNLIKDNKSVLDHICFKEIIKTLSKKSKESWWALVDTSLGKTTDNPLAKVLMLIRNKIAFHYDPKVIMKGYKHFFMLRKTMDKAYISRGNTMSESRFYYADAAAESSIKALLGSDDTRQFFILVGENLEKLNSALYFIVINFITKRCSFREAKK